MSGAAMNEIVYLSKIGPKYHYVFYGSRKICMAR